MKWDAEYTLYLVTDRGLMSTGTLSEAVEQAVLGGCTMVQLREKTADSRAFYDEALRIKAVRPSPLDTLTLAPLETHAQTFAKSPAAAASQNSLFV